MFQAIFDNSPVGLVLVNHDTTLKMANNYMFKTFGIEPADIIGQRFGNVFQCSTVFRSGVACGEAEACNNCGLRAGVKSVLEKNVTIPDTVMDHSFHIGAAENKKWFIISASQIESESNKYAIVSFADITAQKEYEALLNNQLTLDMATGLSNKHALLSALKNLHISCDRISVALIDFDDFKSINEQYGHAVGDKVLTIFSSCATVNTRKQDIVGRFGGEEFMLIFPNTSSGLMIMALHRISNAMKEQCHREVGFRPTFSAGVAEFDGADLFHMDIGTVIAEVDAGLYTAKRKGKNLIAAGGICIPLI